MKTSKQTLWLLPAAVLTILIVSWNRTPHSRENKTAVYDRIFSNANNYLLQTDYGNPDPMMAEDTPYDSVNGEAPPAEDVLVQKIPGDNQHILIMAIYPFAKYSGPYIKTRYDNAELILRDDGKDYDKVAGDGVFTAKIYADVNEFRQKAIEIDAAMRKDNYKTIQFSGRELKSAKDCIVEPFDLQKLDQNQPVSISSLTSGNTNELIDSVRRNCIFITDLKVVEDPTRTWNYCTQSGNIDGPWTFKTLMKNLAKTSSTTDPTDAELSTFVLKWLNNWKSVKIINDDTIPARSLIFQRIITPWQTKSFNAGSPSGQLDMRFAPFKLTAIVNRFDLRERAAGIPAGEGRFTFCLIESNCTRPLEMTCVIEYAIPKPDICDTLQNWAQQWFNLKNFTLGSPGYNAALQAITDQYSKWGTGNRVGNTNLDAIRTNERELAPLDGSPRRWEFREFGLNASPRAIVERRVAQIPQDKYNAQVDNPDVRAMVAWINANKANINADNYTLPDTLSNGKFFMGGHAQILDTPVGLPTKPYHWDGVEVAGPTRIKNTTTRHVFSLNTCTGCHSGELQTFFTHVDPVMFGTQATLSGFLAGKAGRGGAIDFDNNPNNDSMMVRDAALRGSTLNGVRMFNDILRRAKDLKDFALTPPCTGVFALKNELMFQPVHAVH
ncbi:hypothetical protein FRZ67_21150 [Panacibacter ginsenosidivorans]|uniref:Uncharacterized protein n=1 Tax=Panacibacter ginsenosidivorans TaxID=1813871 RepID=A0A5B8VDX9_9BACT|nr:choice-of-anchor X domain-containing protein [Panacibacter ginsenosidivorans]QEC69684.1 hypothetical protein FRZ67_21150 [Panacibacter ginsenosidivorans]